MKKKYKLILSKGTLLNFDCPSIRYVDKNNIKELSSKNEAIKIVGTKFHMCQRCLKGD